VAAIEREGALSVDDVLDRRLRLGLVPAWYEAARPAVESLIDDLLGGCPQGASGSASPMMVGR